MQMRGWNTAYINIPQAAGLATERLSGHVKQRIRWARGMVQILRVDNPLFAPGLSGAAALLLQRDDALSVCAAAADLSDGAADLLILGHTNVPGYWAAILAYAFPHLVLSNVTNSRIQGSIGTRSGTRFTRRCWRLTFFADDAGADQSEAGQLQRDGQGRRGGRLRG
jgi:cellulose synthase (UDP-forming)